MSTAITIGLNAVILGMHNDGLHVLCVDHDGEFALPYGPFNADQHRTFELALRQFVTEQTGFEIGYVEQLYTFGDKGRDSPQANLGMDAQTRVISVGYLALTPQPHVQRVAGAHWRPVYDFFPWEDWRDTNPHPQIADIRKHLKTWHCSDHQKQQRANTTFPPTDQWNEERVLDRYELLYETKWAAEVHRDQSTSTPAPVKSGLSMASDHRRILATALSRLRAKIKYRPVIFELMPHTFTLSELQNVAEGITGQRLHKQNFRRGVEKSDLVQATGRMNSHTGGRPAALYAQHTNLNANGQTAGLSLPGL